MVTLDRLKYFVAGAHHEHIGKAAIKLSISPSVISSAIKALEQELGCELFSRENQRIKLTPKGELLLEKANEILENTRQLYVHLSSDSLEPKGHYRIGGSHFLMQEFLIPTYLDLYKKYSKISADLMSFDSAVAISKVLSGKLDFALVFRSSYQTKIEEEILYQGNFQIGVRKNHPILKKTKDKEIIQEINNLPAITFRSSGDFTGLDFWENHPTLNSVGIIPKHTFFYEDNQTATQLLTQTNGWVFMPDLVFKKNKNIVPIHLRTKLNAPVNISIVWNDNKPLNSFLKILKDNVQLAMTSIEKLA